MGDGRKRRLAPVGGVARRRVILLAALLVPLIALAVLLLVLLTGDGPAEGAAKLVPGEALAYVHLSTDRGRDADRRAAALAARVPAAARLRDRLLAALGAATGGRGPAIDPARDVRPWLGTEAALALLPAGGGTSSLLVFDVSDRARARAFLSGRLGRPTAQSTYRGVEVASYGSQAVAFVSHYLALGPPGAVQEAIEAEAGRRPGLANNAAFKRATKDAPDGRTVDLYASSDGVRTVLAARGGVLGTVGNLLDQPALAGAALSVSAEAHGARARLHTALDPAQAAPPSPFAPFSPTLAAQAPDRAVAYLELSGLGNAGGRLVGAGATGGVGARIAGSLGRVGQALSARGIDVGRDILPVLRGEFALELTPGAPVPTITLIARTPDEARARAAFAQLQAPVAQIFAPTGVGPGIAPTFTQETVAGVDAFRLRLSPTQELDYAVFDGKLVASTSLQGIAAVRARTPRLAGDPDFRAAAQEHPKKVTSIVFLDLNQLLGLIEQTGLGQDPRFRAVRDDVAPIRSVGLASSRGESDSTVELIFKIP